MTTTEDVARLHAPMLRAAAAQCALAAMWARAWGLSEIARDWTAEADRYTAAAERMERDR